MKQKLEATQILNIMRRLNEQERVAVEPMPPTAAGVVQQFKRVGYAAHPAVRGWRGYEPALALYLEFVIREWVSRGGNNTTPHPYDANWLPNSDLPYIVELPPADQVKLPPWVGDNLVHATHRSKLLFKDPDFYGQYGWTEGPSLSYVWPDPKDYEGF